MDAKLHTRLLAKSSGWQSNLEEVNDGHFIRYKGSTDTGMTAAKPFRLLFL
jgi:hypothetical protein